MSKNLKIQVLLSAMDKMSSPFKSAQSQANKLAQSLKQNKSVFNDLKKAYNQNEIQIKKYANTLNPLKAKLRENTASLKQAYAEVRRMETAMKGMANPTTAFVKRLEQAKKTVSSLQKEQAITAQKLKAARAEFSKNGFEASKMSQRQTELRRKMREANQAIDQQRQKLDKLNKKAKENALVKQQVENLKKNSERFANFGQKSMMIGAGTTATLAKPTMEFAKAESAATNLKVAMMGKDGKVSADFEKINQLATQLGNKLPGNAADFQDLMTMLIRQGMSAQTILGGTGEAAAYLAVQLEMPPKQAAEFAAKMQDATRATEADMMDLMDVIQKGFYAGVDPTNMLGAFKNLGSAMDTIKMKGIDGAKAFAPFVAMFDQAGMDGSSQGNAMRKVLQKAITWSPKSKDAKKLKKALGKDYDKIVMDFTDGKGEFGGFDKFFAQLEKFKALDTQSRSIAIKEMFGDDAEVNMVISTLLEKGKAGYEEFAQKMEEQANLRQRVEAQLQTLTNVWDAASGTFTNLLAGVGETIAPQLKELADRFGEISEQILNWVKANPELTGTIVKSVAAFGVLMITVGTLSMIISHTLYPIGRLILSLTKLKSVWTISKALLFGKTLADGSKQAGLFAKAANLLGRMWKGLPNIFTLVGKGVKAVGSHLAKYIALFGKSLLSVLPAIRAFSAVLLTNPVFLVIAGIVALIAVLYLLWKHWDKVKEAMIAGWNWICEKFDQNPILNVLFSIVPLIRGIIWVIQNWGTIVDTVSNAIGTAWENLKTKAGEVWTNIKNWFADALKPLESLKAGVQWLIDNLSKISWDGIKEGAKSLGNTVKNYASEKMNQAGDYVNEKWQNTKAFFGFGNNEPQKEPQQKWSGGFTGHGGKYEPAGIVHRGEYVMTKEATARLGVANLNRLNYGGVLGMAAVASTMATAQPMPAIKVDNRPPIASQQLTAKPQQAVSQNITITINASPNQSEAEIARQVEKALQAAQQRTNARNRSSLRDRG